MDEQIARFYEDAPRFDEGIIELLDDYTGTLYEEMECEAKHFFQEGFRAGQAHRL